jgi:hypothetical protein
MPSAPLSKSQRPSAANAAITPVPRSREEWSGGSFLMPSFVFEGESPYRPHAIVWMTEEELIVGATVVPPGDIVGATVESFDASTRAPMAGQPRVPSRVRVASPELAETLRARLGPDVEVRVAPTPELDTVVDQLREHLLGGRSDDPPSYLGGGIDVPAMASFFRAAADLYRAAPWKSVPSDTDILELTIPSLGVHDVVVCVIGQAGESYGVLFFDELADFEAYLEGAEAAEADGAPPERLARLVSLNFDRRTDVEPELREEIAEHGWEVAGSKAYPWLLRMDADLVARPLTLKELSAVEVAVLALSRLCKERKALARAFTGGPPAEATYMVDAHAGETEVTLRAPYPRRA